MSGEFCDISCPKCGARLLQDGDNFWCSLVGVIPCNYGVTHRVHRAELETDLEARRKTIELQLQRKEPAMMNRWWLTHREGFDTMGHEFPLKDAETLREIALSAPVPRVIEVGTWAGGTALMLANVVDEVYCVDHWEGNPDDRLGPLAAQYGPRTAFRTWCRNMGDELLTCVWPCVGRSRTWAEVWPKDKKAGLIFLDASHRYEDVRNDIQAWSRHIAPGGYLVVHDFGIQGFEGVTLAVEEFMPGYQRAGLSLAFLQVPVPQS